MSKVLRIERKYPRRDGVQEAPFLTANGYKMADPRVGDERHHSEHAIFAATLDEVAIKLGSGHSLWMKDVTGNLRETLISENSLNIIRT
jgi:hypothetical protein